MIADTARIEPYNLADHALMEPDGSPGRAAVFVPPRTMVVIGRGSDASRELNLETIAADGIPVLRRATGGCAVVLTPEMAAISFALYQKEQLRSTEYFQIFNGIVMRALEKLGVNDLTHRGISDVALGGRKIAGTAIYRNRELVFYHAILNVAGSTELMERYLQHPPRVPDYRENRSHKDFVTSLREAGYSIDIEAFGIRIQAEFELILPLQTI